MILLYVSLTCIMVTEKEDMTWRQTLEAATMWNKYSLDRQLSLERSFAETIHTLTLSFCEKLESIAYSRECHLIHSVTRHGRFF